MKNPAALGFAQRMKREREGEVLDEIEEVEEKEEKKEEKKKEEKRPRIDDLILDDLLNMVDYHQSKLADALQKLNEHLKSFPCFP